MATHTFHKLVNSARLFMKKASWGCCVLVFDSSGEPAGHPDFSNSFVDYESSMYCSTCCVRGDLGQSHLFLFQVQQKSQQLNLERGTSQQKLKREDRGDHAVPEFLVAWCLWRGVRQLQ